MDNFVINNPELESRVYEIINEGKERHDLRSCYEFSRFISSELPRYGYSSPHVRDGVAFYNLDFLMDLCDSTEGEELKNVLYNNSQKFDCLEIDHSWCELFDGKNTTRIDSLSRIRLPEGIYNLDTLLLTNADVENSKAEYFPIGGRFRIFNNTFIYTPSVGLKVIFLQFPKIVRLKEKVAGS